MPHQPNLFDDLPLPPSATGLVAVPGSKGQLSREQQTFNRLTELLRKQRLELQAWQQASERLQRRAAAELAPVAKAVRQAQLRLALRFDVLLRKGSKGERLSGRRRHKLKVALLDVLHDLLDDDLDDAARGQVEALFNRHAGLSKGDSARMDREIVEAMLSDLLGEDMKLDDAGGDFNDLIDRAAAKLQERAEGQQRQEEARRSERAEARRAKGLPPTKAERAAQARDQARKDASQSVRELFRRLASALHPDREPDPAEHARKTALMQRVNDAYERSDLLALLGLQLEIEQIDANHLAGLPDERIKAFNQVLRDQLRALEDEVRDLATICRQAGIVRRRAPRPQDLDAVIDADLASARATIAHIERSLAATERPTSLRALIDALPEEDDDPDDLATLLEFMRAVRT